MKKVMFLQNEGNVIGGVWYVNKTIGEQLINKGYDVSIVSIRNNLEKVNLIFDEKLKIGVINDRLPWDIMLKKDIIIPLKNVRFITFLKNLKNYFKDQWLLKKDYKKMKNYIRSENPDYIIASHYMVLKGIPKEYLKKTIHEQHSSVPAAINNKSNYKTLKQYNDKIYKMVWLSKSACSEAVKNGIDNSICIYNPIRFITSNKADVINNKRLIVVSRIEDYNKRITLMLKIVDEVLKNKKLKDWHFDIYGVGDFSKEALDIMRKNDRIVYHGSTINPMDEFMKSSINLNTSISEGFSLSILEASMCGVPTITFDFGESVYEEVNENTGIVVEKDNVSLYKDKLIDIMLDTDKLKKLSHGAKEFSNDFLPAAVVLDWIDIFNKIDKE